MDPTDRIDRRRYLALAGAAGAIGIAGCLEDAGGNGDGEDGGNGNGNGNENGNGNGNGENASDGNVSDDETESDADDNETADNETDGDATGNETADGENETADNETTDNGSDGNGTDGNETDDGEGREIVAGTASGFPPFEMVEDGELVGFDIDLLEAVVAETEYELAGWEDLEFDSLQPALQNGNIDVIAAAMTITEERQESIAFSDPYYSADQSVLVAEDGEFQPEELADLEDSEIGAQSGTTGETVVNEDLIDEGLIGDDQYTSFDNYVLAVEDLERGLIDAVVLDEPVGETFQADRAVEVAFVFETGEEYAFAVRQDDEALQGALSEGIAVVEEASDLEEITREWFGE